MAQRLTSEVFRSTFKTIDKEALHWFPGHMNKGMKQMQHKLRSVDCIIEVHDARIPFSGRNTQFKYTISGIKPHILVLNKVDMIDRKLMPTIEAKLKGECENVIFTNCKKQKCSGIRKLFPLAKELINKSDRYNRNNEEDFSVMIIGIPNVGKSSLINSLRNKYLRKGNATQVGAVPGITRSLLTKIKISEKPLFYLYDTPGVLTPSVPNTEIGLKLALCNTIHEHLVGETIIADYLLYWFNKHENFSYVETLKLNNACDDILEVLAQVAVNNNKLIKVKDLNHGFVTKPDLNAAAKFMIKMFREGKMGRIMLDEEFL